MIIEKIRQFYGEKAEGEKSSGWPTGSRLGHCTAALQFKRYPGQSNPEKPKARDMIRFDHGHIEEDWLTGLFRKTMEEGHDFGLQQEPFYFAVPLSASDVDALLAQLANRQLWGMKQDNFRPPFVQLRDGREKPFIRLLQCPNCDRDGRWHTSKPCGKRLGFIVDPAQSCVWVPVYVDWIMRDVDRLVVVEGKTMSNYGFRDVLLARVGWERLAQLVGLMESTGMDAKMVVERKETHHLVELDFSRRHQQRKVTIRKLTGQTEEYFLKGEQEPNMPADAEWDLAYVDNPFDEALLGAVHQHVRRVLLFKGNAGPGSKDVHRQYGPSFECETCNGTGLQRTQKGNQIPLVKGPKPCKDCNATGKLDRAELGFPCSYCAVNRTCYPMVSLEIDSKPHFYIDRPAWETSGLTFTPGPYRA